MQRQLHENFKGLYDLYSEKELACFFCQYLHINESSQQLISLFSPLIDVKEINEQDVDGNTLLHLTVLKGLECKNQDKPSSYYYEGFNRNTDDIFKSLIKLGLDPSVKNKQGQSPIEMFLDDQYQRFDLGKYTTPEYGSYHVPFLLSRKLQWISWLFTELQKLNFPPNAMIELLDSNVHTEDYRKELTSYQWYREDNVKCKDKYNHAAAYAFIEFFKGYAKPDEWTLDCLVKILAYVSNKFLDGKADEKENNPPLWMKEITTIIQQLQARIDYLNEKNDLSDMIRRITHSDKKTLIRAMLLNSEACPLYHVIFRLLDRLEDPKVIPLKEELKNNLNEFLQKYEEARQVLEYWNATPNPLTPSEKLYCENLMTDINQELNEGVDLEKEQTFLMHANLPAGQFIADRIEQAPDSEKFKRKALHVELQRYSQRISGGKFFDERKYHRQREKCGQAAEERSNNRVDV